MLARHGVWIGYLVLFAACLVSARAPAAQPDLRVAITIYEFRSSVSELDGRATTDMFVTALLKTGRYRVVERSQLDYGVMREKQLSAAGQATGEADRTALRGAKYVIEGTVSEASVGESGERTGFSIAGLSIGRSKNKETLGIDVRVVDAGSGDVVDSISVKRPLAGSSSSISGIGAAAASVLAQHGKTLPYSPDLSHESTRQDSLDASLRALIDAAVAELGERGAIK